MANANLAVNSFGLGTKDYSELRILVLDDDEFDRERLHRLSLTLPFPTKVDGADGLASLMRQLDAQTYDVILIDYRLSAGDGMDALEIINTHKINRSAAQIMVAGDPQFNVAVQAMKQGCDDFIAKDRLDAKSLQESVLDALIKSTHESSKTMNHDLQELAESISNGLAEACLAKMRPMLARIKRQTNFLGQHAASMSKESVGAFQMIEQSCGVLSEFLDEIRERDPSIHAHSVSKVVLLQDSDRSRSNPIACQTPHLVRFRSTRNPC